VLQQLAHLTADLFEVGAGEREQLEARAAKLADKRRREELGVHAVAYVAMPSRRHSAIVARKRSSRAANTVRRSGSAASASAHRTR
jgi:hypothetical protein